MRPWTLIATSLLFVIACGGPRPRRSAREEEATGSALGSRMTIPGSGVSFEPPEGASLLPLGPGVDVPARDMTFVVAIADGDAAARRAFREGIFPGGSEGRRRQVVLDGALPATLGRDVLPGPAGAMARVWLLTERGTRALALLCTYRDADDESLERLATASLMSVHWDASTPLSPSEAIGLGFGPAEGMAPD